MPRSNRGRRLPPEPLAEREVLALIGACSRRAPTGLRNAALITLLWRAGLRVSEALALRPKDVDLASGTVRVLRGKGGHARTVSVGPLAAAVAARWLERRAALGIGGRERLFCTLRGGPVSSGYVRTLLPRLAERVGVEKRCHPHGLRHSFAVELRRAGVDVGVISKALGHRSIATTARYLDHVAPEEVLSALREREEPAALQRAVRSERFGWHGDEIQPLSQEPSSD